ncbi:response regulator [Flavobacterium ajazii]|uniref:response regulator n=1 Tax=Flavobacterium ajazii TaxID=2692318 RepID=UPI0013D7D719|nr:response regulator [Flavobacterium ajazii]
MTKFIFLNRIYFVILFSIVTNQNYAQTISLKEGQKYPYNLTNSVSTFKDSTASLGLREVQKQIFTKTKKEYLSFPFSNAVYWIKFKIKNNSSTHRQELFLLWANPLVEQLDFYISNSSQKKYSHKTQKIITSEREKTLIDEYPKFPITLEPNQSKSIFIKVSSKRGHFAMVRLYSKQAYYFSRIDNCTTQGLLNGLIIFRLFLIFTLSFFVIKELDFRLYSVIIVFKTLAYWGYTNIAGPLFTNNPELAVKINFLCYSNFSTGVAIFLLYAVDIKKISNSVKRFILISIFVSLFLNVMTFFDYQWYWLKGGIYNVVLSCIYFLVLIIYCLYKKMLIDIYYAIPIILGLIGTTLLYFPLTGWIEYFPFYGLSYALFTIEIIVFIFFLGRIIKKSEQKKVFSEKQLQLKQLQNKQLKELDDLKTRFFTNISHEFRTPLTLLVGPVDDLQKKYPNESILKIMQRNLSRLQNLINQILEISKLEAGEMGIQKEKADIVLFLQQLIGSFESLAQDKSIVFNLSINQNQEFGYFDLDKLEKIIINLLSNAFKFTPKNGRITVQILFDNFGVSSIKHKTERSLEIIIEDSGIGIAQERLSYIFNRFYQIDDSNQRQHEGTGIGLALVKELMDVLKGTIKVESKVNKGTRFSLNLPYEHLDTPTNYVHTYKVSTNLLPHFEIGKPDSENQQNNNDDAKIMLIIEDNPDLRFYIASIFENQYQLIMAADGEEGLEKAIEFVPDIIISDLMMPKLDGLSLCFKLKNDERISHIPIIMLTAKATVDDKLVGLQQGADDYLSKPFNKEELILRVGNLIQQRQLLREKYTNQTIEINPEIIVVPEPTIEDLFIEKAQAVIDSYLEKSEFDAATFASEMKLTSVQLRRKLKAITNQTTNEFVRNYRLEKASEMLKKGNKTVSQIAFEVGFESLPYFSKVFQEKFGKTASEWR